ncbi:universal stress protein [Marinobacter mobilis]|uniref:Transcriptional regulator, AraC family n=1 Tax=Marinobacter mobilis TaxID=488533 RepID=A0A1H2R3T8_9GAMM|nr:universal stress protein [Marinobacter mobilis]SDW13359.1 transcriptional regulator, AraC family [Marinobacter mobilis]
MNGDRKLKVLYACDPFRDLTSLNPGGGLFGPETASLLVVMVCEVPQESLSWFRKNLLPPHQLRTQVVAREEELQERMYDVVKHLESLGYEVDSKVLRGRLIGECIVDVAQQEAVDLILVERRRQSPWQRLLLGSVTDYLNRHADQPLLITPLLDGAIR